MQTFIAVCLGLITLELAVVLTMLAMTLVKVGRAAQAVEVLAYRVDEQVAGFGQAMRSGWVSGVQSVFGLVGRFWNRGA